MENNSSPSLRFMKLWLGIGWTLIIAVIVASLMPPTPINEVLFNLPHGDKVGHFMAYLILMGWFAQIYHDPRHRFRYMIGFLLLGVILEILQGLSGLREADWKDIVANSLGVLLAWQLAKTHLAYLLISIEHKFCSLRS